LKEEEEEREWRRREKRTEREGREVERGKVDAVFVFLICY
jgi:hypothetical protein